MKEIAFELEKQKRVENYNFYYSTDPINQIKHA